MHTLLNNRISVWLLGGFGLLSILVATDTSFLATVDDAVLDYFVSIRTSQLDGVFEFITAAAGFWGVIVLLGGMTLWLIERKAYRWLSLLWAVSVANFLLVDVLKLIFNRARPDSLTQLVSETSLSYPSGHTMIAVVLYGYSAYLIHLYVKTNRAQAAIALGWLTFVVLIGLSRMYLGIHYLSDVVASLLLGGSILFALTHPQQSQKPD